LNTMPLEQEVVDIGKQLEKLVAEGQSELEMADDLLKRLKELPITLDILQKTRIGMSVNVVRKASKKEETQTLAKSLIKLWKKLLDGQAEKQKLQRQASSEKSTDSNGNTAAPQRPSPPVDVAPPERTPANTAPDKTSNVCYAPQRGDVEVRKKFIQMIKSSLVCQQRPGFDQAEKISSELEDAIFLEFKNTESKYRNRVKSRVLNLRDKNNPDLLINFLDGHITPERLAKMASEEMASDQLKADRDKFLKEGINDSQMGQTGGTVSTMMKCGKCGKSKVMYNQLQTRSSDEPMTTFCFCQECGHRWKFC